MIGEGLGRGMNQARRERRLAEVGRSRDNQVAAPRLPNEIPDLPHRLIAASKELEPLADQGVEVAAQQRAKRDGVVLDVVACNEDTLPFVNVSLGKIPATRVHIDLV